MPNQSNYTDVDLLGEGTADPSQAPDQDPAELERIRRLRAQVDAANAPRNLYDRNASQSSSQEQEQGAYQSGNIGGASGAYNAVNDSGRAQFDYMHELGSPSAIGSPRTLFNTMGERVGVSHAGDASGIGVGVKNPFDFNPVASVVDPNRGLGTTAGAAGGATAGKPVTNLSPATRAAATGIQNFNPVAAAVAGAFGGGGGGMDLNGYIAKGDAQSNAARAELAGVTGARNTQAQNMFASGASAQGRAAPVAQTVSYGAPQTVQAPTLAPAQQASMGSYGGPQTIQAQQASASQASNQAGFLGDSAARARGVADLDFGQSNESRGAQQGNLARIGGFLDSGPGPSMAQQQLRQAQEQSLGDALSLARSGRGNAAGNMKMAVSENAATNAQTNQQAALLRAQEADMWQQRQLQGMGLEQTGAGALRGQDLGAAQAQGQQALSREQLAGNIDVSRAGLEQGLSQFNAGQSNQVGMQNAQLGTEAGIQQAGLANALNIAQGNAGTNVNLQNAEQGNLNSRLQGQMGLDASSQTAQLANALSIAQGNSSTQIGLGNLDAAGRATGQNDALQLGMTGYGMDSQKMGQDALTHGIDTQTDYYRIAAQLAAEDTKARAMKDAAKIGGGAALVQTLIGGKK